MALSPEVEAWRIALQTEQKLRDEVIAWRNRFQDYYFDPGKGMVLPLRLSEGKTDGR